MSEDSDLDRIAEAVKAAAEERRRNRFSSAGRRARGRPLLQVSLPGAVVRALEARCERTGETKSHVVDVALREFLEVGP